MLDPDPATAIFTDALPSRSCQANFCQLYINYMNLHLSVTKREKEKDPNGSTDFE